MSEISRQSTKSPATPTFNIRCESWSTFSSFYAADVSRGGMFIVTEAALQPLDEIEVVLELPEGHRLQVRARVVNVVDEATAAANAVQRGAGVEFHGLGAQAWDRIHELVEHARWASQGGQGSYAKAMFESGQSLPPSELFRDSQPTVRPARTSESSAKSRSGVRRRATEAVPSRPAPQTSSRRPASLRHKAKSGAPNSANSAPPTSKDARLVSKHEQDLALALTHIAHKRDPAARKLLTTIRKEDPQHLEAGKWLLLLDARAHHNEGKPELALKTYERLLALDAGNHEARTYVKKHKGNHKLGKLPFSGLFSKGR